MPGCGPAPRSTRRPTTFRCSARASPQLQKKFGFDPKGHAGKALEHALTTLPHDLLIAFSPQALEDVALTAMSLADRPRPKLVLAKSILGRHLFAFVWLPRDELTTARRLAIGDMLSEAAGGPLLNWAVAMDDVVAMIRYTIDLRGNGADARRGGARRAARADDARLGAGGRGGAGRDRSGARDAARAALGELLPAKLSHDQHRRRGGARHLAASPRWRRRASARCGCTATSTAQARLKLYRLGGAIALSDAVPVLENFGFRVIEEVPTALTDDGQGFIHEFLIEAAGGAANVFDGDTDGAGNRDRRRCWRARPRTTRSTG